LTICLPKLQPTPPGYAVVVALLDVAAHASGVMMMVAGGVPSESADVVAAGSGAATVCI